MGDTIPYSTAVTNAENTFSPPWYLTLVPGGTGAYDTYQAGSLIFGSSGDVSLTSPSNIVSGTLSPSQIAQIQAETNSNNGQVLANAVAAYGSDSTAAQAIQGVLASQNASASADISAVNQSSDPLLNATGIPWYLWAAAAMVGIVLLERR